MQSTHSVVAFNIDATSSHRPSPHDNSDEGGAASDCGCPAPHMSLKHDDGDMSVRSGGGMSDRHWGVMLPRSDDEMSGRSRVIAWARLGCVVACVVVSRGGPVESTNPPDSVDTCTRRHVTTVLEK